MGSRNRRECYNEPLISAWRSYANFVMPRCELRCNMKPRGENVKILYGSGVARHLYSK